MKAVFRVDASVLIGTGHVMRCLVLANALRGVGYDTSFICREHAGNLIDLIRERDFSVTALPRGQALSTVETISPSHPAWLGVDWLHDAEQTLAALAGYRPDWLIVDHYGLGVDWERALRPFCCRMLVVDDLADRSHDCDLLLDQNLGHARDDYISLLPSACRSLIGPAYALLRPEFSRWHRCRSSSAGISRILVTMGGVDATNLSSKVLQLLASAGIPAETRVDVVMGAHAPHLPQILSLTESMPFRAEVLVNVQDMAGLMALCDLAIGGAGVTAWERCCVGLPSLIVIQAENQQSGARALAAAGAAIVLEAQFTPEEFLNSFAQLQPLEILARMRSACFDITDGLGASRVFREMEGFRV